MLTAATQPLAPTRADGPVPVGAPIGDATCPDALGALSGPIVFGFHNNLVNMRIDGSGAQALTALTRSQWAHDPAWSPDGTALLYTLTRPGTDPNLPWLQTATLCTWERASGKGRVLAQPPTAQDSFDDATWTPDGRGVLVTLHEPQIALGNYVGDKLTIIRYDLAAQTFTPLIKDALNPQFSPDGTRLAYIVVDPQGASTTLTLAQADGTQPQSIPATAGFANIAAPRWSPASRTIIFTASGSPASAASPPIPRRSWLDHLLGIEVVSAHGVPSEMWLVDADGRNLRPVTRKALDDPRAAWSGDGQQVVYVGGYTGVRLLDVATGKEQLVSDQGDYGGIAWVRQ